MHKTIFTARICFTIVILYIILHIILLFFSMKFCMLTDELSFIDICVDHCFHDENVDVSC